MSNQSTPWAIIGMGMGGKGVAAELGLVGYRLRVHDIVEDQIRDIGLHGGLKVQGREGDFAPVEFATTDLGEAVESTQAIIICTWGTEHARVAKDRAPLLVDGQLILLIQGNAGGSLVVRNELKRAGCAAEVGVAQFDGFPYMMNVLVPDSVLLTTNKEELLMAAVPATRNDAVMAMIGDAFPMARPAPNILHLSFDKGGVLHVPAMITNVGFVESDREYHHYTDGMTPSVIRLLQALDAERVAVARAYGVPSEPVDDWLFQTYGVRERLAVRDNSALGGHPLQTHPQTAQPRLSLLEPGPILHFGGHRCSGRCGRRRHADHRQRHHHVQCAHRRRLLENRSKPREPRPGWKVGERDPGCRIGRRLGRATSLRRVKAPTSSTQKPTPPE